MRNNTYIHIRREGNSLMTEQKFPCEGIEISLRGNRNFLAREFLRHAAGLRALGIMLVLMGLGASWNGAWGQQNTINMSNVPIRHVMVEDLYVNPGTPKSFVFQDHDTQGNLDGYIRWFVTDKNLEEATAGDEGNVSISQLSVSEGYTDYNNGYAWYNTGNLRPNADLCTVGFTFDENDIGKYLVCDASSVFATRETKSYGYGQINT